MTSNGRGMRAPRLLHATSTIRFTATLLLVVVLALMFSLSQPQVSLAATGATSLASLAGPFDLNDARVPPDVTSSERVAASAVTASSGDYRIDALLSGYALTGTTVTYSFYKDDVFHGAYGDSSVTGVHEVSQAIKDNVRAVMAWYSSVININFVEVTETTASVGYIRFMDCDMSPYAFTYYPVGTAMFSIAGDVHFNSAWDRLGDWNGFQYPAGRWGYATILHEVGHALGLKHPFESPNVLPTAEDNRCNTIMSYTDVTTELGQCSATPMVYDLLALQDMYGARPKNTGDDTYVFTGMGTGQYALNGTTWFSTPFQIKQTMWDSGGTDTLDASALPWAPTGYRFDLRGGGWLTGNSEYQGASFDFGCSLAASFEPENFINSSSSDTIYANSSANVFGGYSAGRGVGADTIFGANSVDTIDLSGYTRSSVTRTASGSDLILGLGPYGSVKLVGYYSGDTPVIVYAPTGSVSGTVTSGGQPVSDVTVSVAGLTATTDSSGSYSIADVSVGTYVVSFVKQGYVAQSSSITVAHDQTVAHDAALVRDVYTLTYAAGAGGTLGGATAQTVSSGGSGSAVTAVASSGYHFVNWSDGNTANPRTDTNVTGNLSVTANFALTPINTYTISFNSNGGSAVAPITQNYNTLVCAPTAPTRTGYTFAGWCSDSGLILPYTFTTMPASNMTLYAKWTTVVLTYTLTPSAGLHGTISPSTAQTVNYGGSKTFAIQPASGYHIAAVLVDGASVGAVSSYTFTNMTANHTISATFAFTLLKTSLSITSNKTTATRGTTVAFSGTISPHMPNGTHVTVQICKSGSSIWTTLSTRSTFSSYHWSYSYKIPSSHAKGTFYVRVRYAGSTKYLSCNSASRKLVIK